MVPLLDKSCLHHHLESRTTKKLITFNLIVERVASYNATLHSTYTSTELHPYNNQDVREKPDEVGWFSRLTLSWSIIAFRTRQWNENKRFSSYVPCPCWQHHLIKVVRASMMPDLTPRSRSPGTHRHTIRHVPGSQALQSEKKTMASDFSRSGWWI